MAVAWALCAALLLAGVGACDVQGGMGDSAGAGGRQMLMRGKKNKDLAEAEAAAAEGGVEATGGAGGGCACIFGLERVLYQPDNMLLAVPGREGKVPKQASEVVNACQDAGFNVGVVTDNCFDTEIRRVLTEELDSPVFTEAFLDSEALQQCDLDKTPQVTAVYEHYSVSPECAVYFDAGEAAERNATALGVQFQAVGKKGVTKKAMNAGVKRLAAECGCGLA